MNGPKQQAFTRPIAEALAANSTLGSLLLRLKESQARFEVVRTVLPAGLRTHVRPGVLDHEGWNLLAPNGAVAAKLRQCLPLVEQRLVSQGWRPVTIRVKVVTESL